MARKTIQERKLPTVLSFERKLVPSDGLFYGTTWENRHEKRFENAIVVKEKSVRGTISNSNFAGKNPLHPLKVQAL